MTQLSTHLHFWGKAAGPLLDDPLTWHPLPYHCLDVAAAADELLRQNPRRLAAMAALVGAEPEPFRNLLVAMVALHDIGKFAITFQAKVPERWPVDVLGTLRPTTPTTGDHAMIASRARLVLGIKPAFKDWLGAWDHASFAAVWHAVSGHHGQPKCGDVAESLAELPAAALQAACAFRDDVLALFPQRTLLAALRPGDPRLPILSWAVAGLTVAADWMGSNRGWFPYAKPELALADYWPRAQAKAVNAVAQSGLLAVSANADLRIENILPPLGAPSPLQRLLADSPLPDGPMLTIVEDVTGSGKTEAALRLAARLIAAGRASGLFFALPTMATANAMYERMQAQYRRVFSAGAAPSLVLAHGKRGLHEGYQNSILGIGAEPLIIGSDGYDDGSAATCNAWLADDRRKALLAHVGVGTIDQALLSVLPSKYQSLRLWGLADKVLVLDEVHAFDAYMSREIETLLEFHAALGGSAILLSATLPANQRHALAAAFARGLGHKVTAEEGSVPYPLVTTVSSSGTQLAAPATRADRTRSVCVRRIATTQEAVAHVAEIASKDGCVAWIRNSVDDAIDAVQMVRAHDETLTPVLLHARFAMGDRLDIEDQVRRTLGRDAGIEGRKKFVLIGTQILEASLDYDVDAMITDLAPVDLVIQRAGRLWRHTDRVGRPVAEPELLLLSPDPDGVTNADWYRQISTRGAAVYGHHGIVWRSAAALMKASNIATPEGVRGLVEAVYGYNRDDIDDVPDKLRHASRLALGSASAARTFARANLLVLSEGYAGNNQIWTKDTITPTRLGDPVTTFRLGRMEGGVVVPYYGSSSTLRNWALSEVSLSMRKATGVLQSDARRQFAVDKAMDGWPKRDRDMPLLVLAREGSGWTGTVTKDGTQSIDVRYSAATGLRVV